MTAQATFLIGGHFDRHVTRLTATPPRIDVGGVLYSRLDDPDTGDYLGGYVVLPEPPPDTSWVEMERVGGPTLRERLRARLGNR